MESAPDMTRYRYALVLYAYNHEGSVRDAVRAMLSQECGPLSGAPLDIVLSDDGSRDATFAILQEEASNYDGPHRVILNRNDPNLGVIRHIDRMHELTDADVLINCAGDDLSAPERVRRTIDAFERDDPLLVCSHAKVTDADGRPQPRVYAKADFYNGPDLARAATSMQLYLGATASWHRDIFVKYGPIQFENCFEDLVLGFRALLENRLTVLEDDLVTYRIGAGITNTRLAPESPDALRQRREKELSREISVLAQRGMDARRFGLEDGDPILTRIDRALNKRRIRLRYVAEGGAAILPQALRHPVQTVGAVLSENRRWRKALNRKP